jgi:ubiquinone/menaquinone biosynthesis C-methylase UbiE
MTTATNQQAERYDRIARGYARWWAPVIAPHGEAVLDRVAADVEAGATEILDIGTGTGTVAFAALRRWPGVRVTGVDPSDGMLDAAQAAAAEVLTPAQRRRLELVGAFGDRLPFEAGRFEVAVSAFVLQLVPSRGRVLREAHRVLRPGGRMAYVTWLAGERRFAGDEIVDRVLDAEGFEPPAPDPRSGDLRSVAAAAAGLRAAGFRAAQAERRELAHAWTPESYTAFIAEFDEEDTFASMSGRARARATRDLRDGLAALPREELVMRLPIVYASALRAAR